jgi:WD40 repeat protein
MQLSEQAPQRLLKGHLDNTHDIVVSPDGTRILTGSEDGTARLWDARTAQELRRFAGHEGGVYAVAFSPDGGRVATAGWDGTTIVWDANDGKVISIFSGHSGRVTGVAFLSDGNIITSGIDGTLRQWDLQTGEERSRSALFEASVDGVDGIEDMAFSPDGGRAVLVGGTGEVVLWDVAGGTELWRAHASKSEDFPAGLRERANSPETRLLLGLISQARQIRLTSVAFASDGSSVFSAGENCGLDEWDIKDGHHLRKIGENAGEQVARHPTVPWFVLGTLGSVQLARDDKSEDLGPSVSFKMQGPVNAVALAPDGTFVVAAGGGRLSGEGPHGWSSGDKTDVLVWDLPRVPKK